MVWLTTGQMDAALKDDAKGAIAPDKLGVVEELRSEHVADREALRKEMAQIQNHLSRLQDKDAEMGRVIESLDNYLAAVRPGIRKEKPSKPDVIVPIAPETPKPRKNRREVSRRILALLATAPQDGFNAAEIRVQLKLAETSKELSSLLSYLKGRGKVAIGAADRWTLVQQG